MRICTVIGVRPQFVKAAVMSPIVRKEHIEILIHTGQHYDEAMSTVFFRDLDLPGPDYTLTMSVGTGKEMIDHMVRELESIMLMEKADAVLIYGDTNSTLAGALVARKLKIPIIHVEAGERNGLDNNPEEAIRRQVDQFSSLLLCCSEQALENLKNECLGYKACFIGNLMEISFANNIQKPWHPHLTGLFNGQKNGVFIPQQYYLLTCHRQENSNDKCLTEILLAMESAKHPVVYPVHPRNRERVKRIFVAHNLKNIIVIEPVGYYDSIHLINNSVTVVTDSGGVLQEAHFARVPYVFVLDIASPPQHTRFDLSRLVKPQRDAILRKVEEKQEFAKRGEFANDAGDITKKQFEINVLKVLHSFEEGYEYEDNSNRSENT